MRAEILGRERRRRWTDEQKLEIIGAVGVNGATLADVARRHDVTRQQIYTWRHDLKKRALLPTLAEPVFLPVGMVTVGRNAEFAYEERPATMSMVELRLAQGRRLCFDSGIDATILTRLIRSVEAA
ncbi:hypothetical protein M527_03180 [Sphingobium indicum IP26]|uniref:Transposase n=1 Tax=Sphingobium indicum F2 TaxID=1450518 RepID=A0A8E1C4D1_9SPHN|nr:transposase [Sphingobium indicum]EPR11089.1 hypothetical protein M527_03180 [Sphingobium indicum IP26]KER38227.1 transposase [Sphingobium indicum F2]